jgi:hypothetical protein
MSSKQWADFVARLGLPYRLEWGTSVPLMDDKHFLKMEKRLLDASGLHPRLVDLILASIGGHLAEARQSVGGHRPLPHGSLKSLLNGSWPKHASDHMNREVSEKKVIGAITIIADLGGLFTTRDWNVTGTLSALAGAAISATLD